MTDGLIFNIQRFSLHDGPGIRTVVFMKGCPLRCDWCANPESQSAKPDLTFNRSLCVGCGNCLTVCPEGSFTLHQDKASLDFTSCTKCLRCALSCSAGALEKIGYQISPQELIKELLKDRAYYKRSGGGITFSGGEPLMQPDFLSETASLCRDAKLPVAVETCGFGDYDLFRSALENIDLVFFDLKHLNDDKHKSITGVSNLQILNNLKLISQHPLKLVIRYPLIPSINDSRADLYLLSDFFSTIDNAERLEIMPYHKFGTKKYQMLGRTYKLRNTQEASTAAVEESVSIINERLTKPGAWCVFEKPYGK